MSAARQKDEFFNEITMSLGFECTPCQLVISSIVMAIIAPPVGRAGRPATVGAVLASPPAGEPAEG